MEVVKVIEGGFSNVLLPTYVNCLFCNLLIFFIVLLNKLLYIYIMCTKLSVAHCCTPMRNMIHRPWVKCGFADLRTATCQECRC